MDHQNFDENRFEDYLAKQCDIVDNAVHRLICDLAQKEIEWDMSLIGNIADDAVDFLNDNGVHVCYPAYIYQSPEEDHVPCACLPECPLGIQECPFKKCESNLEENSQDLNNSLEPCLCLFVSV